MNEATTIVEHDQQGHQVNNLRKISLDSWKILPDKARETWFNMRLQEKETINGMPKLLWEKLDDDDKKEYLEKWKNISQHLHSKSTLKETST